MYIGEVGSEKTGRDGAAYARCGGVFSTIAIASIAVQVG
jgi:hypothetical protein